MNLDRWLHNQQTEERKEKLDGSLERQLEDLGVV